MEIVKIPVSEIHAAAYNPRKDLQPGDAAYDALQNSIENFGYAEPIIWNRRTKNIVGGHQRFKILIAKGLTEIEVSAVDLSPDEEKAFNIALNKIDGQWDDEKLCELLKEIEASDVDTLLTGFDVVELEGLLAEINNSSFDKNVDETESDGPKHNKYGLMNDLDLYDRFIVPPFSTLDARKGKWQERKSKWKELGLKSEIGRNKALLGKGLFDLAKNSGSSLTGTSIFDPVLCEVMLKWFCPINGIVYDPFAGGSVRGIVAAKLGYKYIGIDLRQEQIDANYVNAKEIGVDVTWHCDDSLNADRYIEDNTVDFIFSCPPYADLEVYSNDPRDISTMEYEDFLKTYRKIISIACRKLRQDRFAVFVVGDVRDKKGFYRNFIGDTKDSFKNNGLLLYNDLVLLESIGTGALRAGKQFSSLRKVVKCHQNVLVFYKGNIQKIRDNLKEIDTEEIIRESLETFDKCLE